MKNNEKTSNEIKSSSRKAFSGAKSISFASSKLAKQVVIFIGSSGSVFIFVILIVLLFVSSVLLSVLPEDPNAEISFDTIDQTVCDSCSVNLNQTKDLIKPQYLSQMNNIDDYIKPYIKNNFGVDLQEGNLNELPGNGEWQYAGYGENNKITIHVTSDFEASASTIITYLEAIYTTRYNLEDAYNFNKTAQGSGLGEAFNSSQRATTEDYMATLEKYKDDLFYINEGIDWSNNLHYETWYEIKEEPRYCSVPYRQEDRADEICPEAIKKNVKPVFNHNKNIYEYNWIEKVKIEKSGLVGDIYVPIYFDSESILKEERDDIVNKYLELDSSLTVEDNYRDYFLMTNANLEATSEACGYTLNLDMFGSSSLIGVGSNGFIGETSVPPKYEMYRYDTSKGFTDKNQLFNPSMQQDVWGYAYNLQTKGLIGGQYHDRQCTTLVHAIFYDVYGYDCGLGDGWDMARNTVNKYPDKFDLSTSPAPGSVLSTNSYNHVAFVHSVIDENNDGKWDKLVISDGNVCNGGIRLLAEYTSEDVRNIFGNTQIYAIPKKKGVS